MQHILDAGKEIKLVHCATCLPGAALLHNGYFPTNKNCSSAIDIELLLFLRSIVLESRTSLYLACSSFSLRYLPFWIEEVSSCFNNLTYYIYKKCISIEVTISNFES